ncbi:MAG: excinuclease ABC subunit UvrA [Planctomycetaceae bacterium]|nr:excinuclease ABC subunit UvrA [Planctomycetaceae bacterium]
MQHTNFQLAKSDRAVTDKSIQIIGARTHNLKNIDVEIPRDQVVVITGLSGSGKSSLAFDTLYAEGQRQYVESLSIFSRQFFNQIPKADVDQVIGLQPTLCLDQSHHSSNRRSTVGTITEIYDYLRLLFARVGDIHCYQCGQAIKQQTPQQIRDRLLELPERTKVMILAPLVKEQTGGTPETIKKIRRERLVRARVNGVVHDIDQLPTLHEGQAWTIEAVTDRIIIRDGIESRLLESIDNAIRLNGEGSIVCSCLKPGDGISNPDTWEDLSFSTRYSCPDCEICYSEVQPRSFSFNSPFGACSKCSGLGHLIQFDPTLVINRSLSVKDGAILPWSGLTKAKARKFQTALEPILDANGCDLGMELESFSSSQFEQFFYSVDKERLGLQAILQKELATTSSEDRQFELESYISDVVCHQCLGSRVSRQARSVLINGQHIGDLVNLPLGELSEFFNAVDFKDERKLAASVLITEIVHRLDFLEKVGIGYLTLGRSAVTLSGGEHQRVRLASSIGTGITNACFILDEPSIGLHQHDNDRLIGAITRLKDSGNSVIVVEHDETMIRAADYVIDMGPKAGPGGGRVVAAGSAQEVMKNGVGLTAQYLLGEREVGDVSSRRVINADKCIRLLNATGNNLKAVNVSVPLGVLCCVSGVSGSGKSTLINQTFAPAISRELDQGGDLPLPFERLEGVDQISRLVMVDQKPIGKTPRACPATFTGLMSELRRMFAATKAAKRLGYGPGRFSFNTRAGWCPDCQGQGIRRMDMNFMPDIFVTCDGCEGKRFNVQTLQVRFGELTIADVLNLTVDQAKLRFEGFSKLSMILECLSNVGLGYLKLGQASSTLSGGEAQRVKLATELSKSSANGQLYVLDEPTTGLHFEDIRLLMVAINRLVDRGNSMVVIEHNIDVLRCADWMIDMGPGGGVAGGEVVAWGTPEQVAENPDSLTGRYL